MLTDPQPVYAESKAEAMKLASKPSFDKADCLLITPHQHNNKLWLRRCISGMKVIYHDSVPDPSFHKVAPIR